MTDADRELAMEALRRAFNRMPAPSTAEIEAAMAEDRQRFERLLAWLKEEAQPKYVDVALHVEIEEGEVGEPVEIETPAGNLRATWLGKVGTGPGAISLTEAMRLMQDIAALGVTEGEAPDAHVLILNRALQIGEDVEVFPKIHPPPVGVLVVIAGDKTYFEAGVGEKPSYVGPEVFSVDAFVKEVAADYEQLDPFFFPDGDELVQGLPPLIVILLQMDICGMEYLHRPSRLSYVLLSRSRSLHSHHFIFTTGVNPKRLGWE